MGNTFRLNEQGDLPVQVTVVNTDPKTSSNMEVKIIAGDLTILCTVAQMDQVYCTIESAFQEMWIDDNWTTPNARVQVQNMEFLNKFPERCDGKGTVVPGRSWEGGKDD